MTLREIVAAQTVAAEELPLVHTTRCEILPHILASHELASTTKCDVFDEYLLYFFYGRPAYRTAFGGKPSGVLDLCPVCFVFRPYTLGTGAKRVFACDSGAIHAGLFKNHLQPADRDEMELDATLDSARKLVPLIFESNEKYFLGGAKSALPAGFMPGTPAARFHALLTSTESVAGDDRRSAIEVQLNSPVLLDHKLLYVVLPKEKLNEPGTREVIIQVWQADPIGYDVYFGRQPRAQYPHRPRTCQC
jgi:hypothetical protein